MHLLSLVNLKKSTIAIFILLFLMIFASKQAHAALTTASDTTTTSRPSPSSPTSANSTSPVAQLTVFNNGSRFLASDSAKIIKTTTGGYVNQNLRVSSQSADLTSVFLGNTTSANTALGADVLMFPITAMHTIQFRTPQAIQSSDSDVIRITFPALATGDSNNPASPSASTFQMNNLGTSTIQVYDVTAAGPISVTAVVTNPSGGGSSPTIAITPSAGSIAANDQIIIYLGCTALSGSSCSTQAPRIINPTKTASSCAGTPETCTASSYKVRLDAVDTTSGNTETATVGVGIIESVTIRATVDPTLTFTITGINNGVDLANGNAGCNGGAYGQLSNSGINSSANNVNLGIIQNTPAAGGALANLAGQLISVSTNGPSGYALTATSSSSLLNPETGYFFLSDQTPLTPTNFAAASDFFGLHVCGNDVTSSWVEGSPGGGSDCSFVSGADGGTTDECLWSWPNPTNQLTGGVTLPLASDSSGPVGSGTGETGDGYTSVSYGAGIDVAVPPGEYRTIITYIATPSF